MTYNFICQEEKPCKDQVDTVATTEDLNITLFEKSVIFGIATLVHTSHFSDFTLIAMGKQQLKGDVFPVIYFISSGLQVNVLILNLVHVYNL